MPANMIYLVLWSRTIDSKSRWLMPPSIHFLCCCWKMLAKPTRFTTTYANYSVILLRVGSVYDDWISVTGHSRGKSPIPFWIALNLPRTSTDTHLNPVIRKAFPCFEFVVVLRRELNKPWSTEAERSSSRNLLCEVLGPFLNKGRISIYKDSCWTHM